MVITPPYISAKGIALKECYESEYWPELLNRTGCIPDKQYSPLQNDCGGIAGCLSHPSTPRNKEE